MVSEGAGGVRLQAEPWHGGISERRQILLLRECALMMIGGCSVRP